jgi:hypothetical protein
MEIRNCMDVFSSSTYNGLTYDVVKCRCSHKGVAIEQIYISSRIDFILSSKLCKLISANFQCFDCQKTRPTNLSPDAVRFHALVFAKKFWHMKFCSR